MVKSCQRGEFFITRLQLAEFHRVFGNREDVYCWIKKTWGGRESLFCYTWDFPTTCNVGRRYPKSLRHASEQTCVKYLGRNHFKAMRGVHMCAVQNFISADNSRQFIKKKIYLHVFLFFHLWIDIYLRDNLNWRKT